MSSATSSRKQVLQAAAIVMSTMVLSRVLGLGRDVVINYYFDAFSLEANAYTIASRIPHLIFTVLAGGALGSAFIPTFAGYFARQDEAGAWRLFSAVLNWATLAIAVVVVFTFVFAQPLLLTAYPELMTDNLPLLQMSVRLLRVMLLSPIIFAASGVVMGALNARQHFLMPALAGSLYNLGIILGAVLWQKNVMGLAYGMVLGTVGHLAIQLPALRQKQARYQLVFTASDNGLRQLLWLMLPRTIGLSFSEISIVVTQIMAQAMPLGSIRALDLAWRVMSMPLGFLGQALGIAAFPTFATLAAESKLAEMRRILADSLRLICFLGVPATVLLTILRQPLIALFFQWGTSSEATTEFVSWALLFYMLGLISLIALEIIARAFYALSDTLTPVLVGAVQLLVMIGLGLGFSQLFAAANWLPFGGLALGHSLSNWLEMLVLLGLLRGKLAGLDGAHIWAGVWRIGVAGILMAFVTGFVYQFIKSAGILLALFLPTLAGTLFYLLCSFVLRLPEWQLLLAPLRRR